MSAKMILGGTALVVLAIAVLVFGPFISIWSLNTLFGTTIAYTWKTWLAIFWIGLWFVGKFSKS